MAAVPHVSCTRTPAAWRRVSGGGLAALLLTPALAQALVGNPTAAGLALPTLDPSSQPDRATPVLGVRPSGTESDVRKVAARVSADWPPGVVVAHSPAKSRQYLGSPSLAQLDDGTLLASHDFFGPGSTADRIHVYGSTDGGASWQLRSETTGFWSTLFPHRGALYLLGTHRQDGWVVIRRSLDGGRTWTNPTDAARGRLRTDGRFHCAPMPVVEHRGRLWRAMEDLGGPGGWGSSFRSFMMSVPSDADLLNAAHWTFSEPVGRNPAWLKGKFGGWLEGNAVVAPDGGVVNILRADYRVPEEKAAIIRIGEDGRTGEFDPAVGFVDFPGGCKKFAVRADPQGVGYWSLANWIPASQQGGNVERTRNTLALLHSLDLRRWELRCVVLHHPDREKHGFQYADFQIVGNDLLGLVRTAHADGQGGAPQSHDANFITFHRWPGFRHLTRTNDVVPGL